MTALLIIIALLFGISLGSFLNVVVDRVPARRSLVIPPSHCDFCRVRLKTLDLVPVFSYIILKGRCRHCGAKLPLRVLIVELLGGVGAASAAAAYGIGATGLLVYLTGLALLVLAIIDIEQGIVPHEIVLPLTVLGLAAAVFYPPLGWKSSLIGGAVSIGVLLVPAVLRPGGIGWGDVKLAPFLGIVSGFPAILVGLFAAFIIGGVAAVVVLVARRGARKTALPFVPFLAVGTMVGLIWGRTVVRWYLGQL